MVQWGHIRAKGPVRHSIGSSMARREQLRLQMRRKARETVFLVIRCD